MLLIVDSIQIPALRYNVMAYVVDDTLVYPDSV